MRFKNNNINTNIIVLKTQGRMRKHYDIYIGLKT